jgi:DNA invertase Pin-like site-specific DNA recombinase
MSETTTGYARCSTLEQDLTAQREILGGLGVPADRIYLDEGLTGTNGNRPGLDQALAAVRGGDTLVVPKLDRLAGSVPEARDIADNLSARGVKLSLGGTTYDPADAMGKMFFNILDAFALFATQGADAKGRPLRRDVSFTSDVGEIRHDVIGLVTDTVAWLLGRTG